MKCVIVLILFLISCAVVPSLPAADIWEAGWINLPDSARTRAYWWWLNSNVTKTAITRDLEGMKAKGFGGAVISDAGGADVLGNAPVPHGPTFMSPKWRELFKHTLREADRLGLEISLTIQSGWDLGGPMVKPEEAAKVVVWSGTRLAGPGPVEQTLPKSKHSQMFYRDIAVLAYPRKPSTSKLRKPIRLLEIKTSVNEFGASAPDCWPVLEDYPPEPGEEDCLSSEVIDLSGSMDSDGRLKWKARPGEWEVLRFGYTITGAKVTTSSDGWKGLVLDYLDPLAFQSYWRQVVEPLIADAGPLAGRSLKYLHTDSWELGGVNWTANFAEEFRRRRGYELRSFLPVLAGRIVDNRLVSNRFLNDFRKTIGDCIADNHYRLMSEQAHRHGLGIHPESGGPHGAPIDSLRLLGMNDIPMSEFWAWSWEHRIGDVNRFFVKQPASAAHTYGKRLVAAEGFTTQGPHWQETIWDNLKPAFDQAVCEGLNRLVWHTFTCAPAETGVPGQEYAAGTHFNPNSTWWNKSDAFLAYLNRCQFMMQQGLFVADACYYYGDHVPNFAQLKRMDPAKVLPGYDYDVATEEVVLTRMAVRDGRIVLPDGMSYRVLVLPAHPMISLPVLRKVEELVQAGATVIGPRPTSLTSLSNYPQCDAELAKLAQELWGAQDRSERAGERRSNGKSKTTASPTTLQRSVGKGRVISRKTAREVLLSDGVRPDFEFRGSDGQTALNYIHRRDGNTEIYFVCNSSNRSEAVQCTFRVAGKQPELWDPVSGQIRNAAAWSQSQGCTTLPLEFAPYGSMFVVFRKPVSVSAAGEGTANFPRFIPRQEITGAWTVKFDPKWGGPRSADFNQLISWTQRAEEGIKFYSGTAIYLKTFDAPDLPRKRGQHLWLDLGDVRQLAEVRLNGKNLGVVWAPPFRVDVTDVLEPKANNLEIGVVNFWPNRIIGDQSLPPKKRFTRTNIRLLTKKTLLMASGLLGPVRILSAEER